MWKDADLACRIPGEMAVFLEVGNEKMRYLLGQATAVESTGQIIEINLNDVYAPIPRTAATTSSGRTWSM